MSEQWTLERARPRFAWNDDKTTLTMKADTPEGTLTTTLAWDTPELAEQNFEAAFDGFIDRFLEKALAGAGEPWVQGQSNVVKRLVTRLGTFYFHVSTGPPTWWLPKVRVKRWTLHVGWLRLAVGASWSRGRR